MKICFWGVRGSIPTPGRDTVEIGGNTSCVEIRCGKTILVFDGGTGLRLLGQKLLAEMPLTAHLFFSHVHWDHIQGFPFFAPAFIGGNTIHLYGGTDVEHTLQETLSGQMSYPNFPVLLKEMAATMTFRDLSEGEEVVLDDGEGHPITVRPAAGNHPNGVWAYRIDHRGKSAVYATDTEHYDDVDPKLLAIARGVDVLIYDSQYTPEEYAGKTGGGSKRGWGHSTFEAGCALAKAAGAKKYVLYHHDPGQSDAAVRDKERRARELFPNVVAAQDGLVLEP